MSSLTLTLTLIGARDLIISLLNLSVCTVSNRSFRESVHFVHEKIETNEDEYLGYW